MKTQCAISSLALAFAAISVFAEVQPDELLLIRVPMTKKISSLKGLQRKRDTKLYNDYGSIYLVDVAVGTPPQVFELAVDTGR